MRAHVDAPNRASLQIENRLKIRLDHYGIDGFAVSGRELMVFAGAKTGIKRILLENTERSFCGLPLLGVQSRQRTAETIWPSGTGSSLRRVQGFNGVIKFQDFPTRDFSHALGEAFRNFILQ